MTKRIFISADHGMAIIYFLQSDVVPTLLAAGVEIILLTDDEIKDRIAERFARPGLIVEGLRLKQADDYARRVSPRWQWLLAYLRRVGGSRHINTAAMDSHVWEVWAENSWKFRLGIWVPAALWTLLLRNFSFARKSLVRMQNRFTPGPGLYTDLFEKYKPDLVIASTPGWRLDRYLLREATRRGIPNATAIIGWDNSSSYNIPGAEVQWATCWSELQKDEMVLGSDWKPERLHVGGIPSYDGYFRKQWLMPREEYFKLHGLDPRRRLISYACISHRTTRTWRPWRDWSHPIRWPSPHSCSCACIQVISRIGRRYSPRNAGRSTRWRWNTRTSTWYARCRWAARSATTGGRTCPRRRP